MGVQISSHLPPLSMQYTAAKLLFVVAGLGLANGDGVHGHAHQHAPLRSGRQEAPLDSYGSGSAGSANDDLGGYTGDINGAASLDDASGLGGSDDPVDMLQSAIPGVPGEDYPIYAEVPETAFACDGQADGGYYADPEAECQVFHICTADGEGGLSKYSFLCPNGTIFNQNYFICDWWFNFDCAEAEALYAKNDEIAAERAAVDSAAAAGGAAGDDAYVSPVGAADDIGSVAYDAPIEEAPASYGSPRAGRQRSGRAGGVRRSG